MNTDVCGHPFPCPGLTNIIHRLGAKEAAMVFAVSVAELRAAGRGAPSV